MLGTDSPCTSTSPESGIEQPDDVLDQDALAGARGAEHHRDLVVGQAQVEAVEDAGAAELLDQVDDLDRVLAAVVALLAGVPAVGVAVLGVDAGNHEVAPQHRPVLGDVRASPSSPHLHSPATRPRAASARASASRADCSVRPPGRGSSPAPSETTSTPWPLVVDLLLDLLGVVLALGPGSRRMAPRSPRPAGRGPTRSPRCPSCVRISPRQPPIGALGLAPQKTRVPVIPMMWTKTMLRAIDFAVAAPTPTGPPEAV